MTTYLPAEELRGPSWLLEVLEDSAAARRVHRWWHWAVLSLGCLSGCATWGQVTDSAAQPLRTTGNLLARTSDRVGDLFESRSTRHRNPENLPAYRGLTTGPTVQTGPAPTALATTQAGAISLPVSKPTATQAIHNTPVPVQKPPESLSVPSAPPAVELLPAPPADVRPINHQQPVTAPDRVTTSTDRSGIKTWCRVRIRNVSQTPIPQVAVTVNSPENVTLVSKEGDAVSAPAAGRMEFAPVAQVGSQEEVILVIGVGAGEQRGQRLRVQVRDGLGGSNHDVQSRWQVAIEALE